jgi:hypothetical protein
MPNLVPAILISLSLTAVADDKSRPSLALPIDCTLGKDCFIQQYVDLDPGPGIKDYRCGTATYDGHSGMDFRVLSVKAAEAGVKVLASAAGRVKGVRDGVEDRLMLTEADRQAVKDRECGNGVVLDHGNGWETQYCHLRRASVTVRTGQTVAAGTPLGLVGYSGQAQFAHVHLSVRQNGAVVDPFTGRATKEGFCLGRWVQTTSGLWRNEESMVYADAQIIETGFAPAQVGPAEVEQAGIAPPDAGSPALVFYARLINMRAGDGLRFKVEGPGGFQVASTGAPLDRNQAQYVGIAGKKRSGEPWPSGDYRGVVEVIRADTVIGTAENTLRLP